MTTVVRKNTCSVLFHLMFVCQIVSFCYSVFAHDPHDTIDSLAVSPTYNSDKTSFLIIQNGFVVRTNDGGASWKKLEGINTKYRLDTIAMSPDFDNDKTLFLSTKGDGVFRSKDSGASWSKVNKGLNHLNISELAISTNYKTDKVVLAAGSQGGLYKSKDGGGEWYQVVFDSKNIRSIIFYPGSRDNHILAGDQEGNIYLSKNKGETWLLLNSIQNCGAITAIEVSPNVSSEGVIFVGTEKGGIWKTDDNGGHFNDVNVGMTGKHVTSLALSPNYGSDSIVFAATWYEAVFKTNNGGDTWGKLSEGLTTHRQADTAKFRSPNFRDLRLSNAYSQDKTIFLGCYVGLFKSTDEGRTWLEMETRPPKLIRGIALSPSNSGDYSIALVTFLGGVYMSDDQGETWSIKNKGLVSLEHNVQNDIVFSPDYHVDHQIFTVAKRCFLKSNDKGNGWDQVALSEVTWKLSWKGSLVNGLKKLGVPKRVSNKVFNYSAPKRNYIWPYRLAISPNFVADKTIFLAGRLGNGVLVSTDGGGHFSQVLVGNGNKVTSMAISNDFKSDRTLFAAVRGEGVYKTIDGGDSWEPKNNGITVEKDVKLLVYPNYRLAISPDYGDDNTLFMGTESGLFKTVNGGVNWKALEVVAYCGSDTIKDIAISPAYKKDKTVIISLKGKGLFRSQDGGLTWSEIGLDLIKSNYDLRFIRFSPLYTIDHTIYGAAEEELFKSSDGGSTWEIIKRPVRYENELEPLQYEGEWKTENGSDYSSSSIRYSEVENSKVVLRFVGKEVRWIGTKSSKQGIAKVYIDGDCKGSVDQFGSEREVGIQSFSVKDLPYGPHTITIEITKHKNLRSLGNRIEIDCFDIF